MVLGWLSRRVYEAVESALNLSHGRGCGVNQMSRDMELEDPQTDAEASRTIALWVGVHSGLGGTGLEVNAQTRVWF